MNKIKFGILSTAKIAVKQLIPAFQQSEHCQVAAVASRSGSRARKVADRFSIPVWYDSYEALLQDDNIDAIYNPLPNHMHVSWTIKTLEAGKHILCEKPLGISTDEIADLVNAVDYYSGLKVMEAFMYRFHPQWTMVKKIINDGEIGRVKTVNSHFSYYKTDPDNIRNRPEMGGGGMLDIGCYCISVSRLLFGSEPEKIFGRVEFDPELHIDRLSHGILYFKTGTATFTCSTQMQLSQRVTIFGTEGIIELEHPFNPPSGGRSSFILKKDSECRKIETTSCNQYILMADAFAKSVNESSQIPLPLEDAVGNMKAIEAVFRSSRNEEWISL